VTGRRLAADGVVELTLADPGGAELAAWEPGAHVDLLLDDALTRQYSLCGDPADRRSWRLGVLRDPATRGGSAYVHDALAVGATVRARGPRNHFELAPAPAYRFVAGGIGITPILPMIAAADAAGAGWDLLYGGRCRTSMAFAEELDRFGDRVTLCPQDECGLPDLAAFLADTPGDTLVYACGPEGLLRAVEAVCAPRLAGNLRVERFAPDPDADAGPRTSFEVVLERSGLTLTVPAERSILEVCREAGVDVISSCEEGTCCTCETDVLDGVPDHRDSVLTDTERELGDIILICVSRSLTPQLVLDL
jgi:ferredoxin-NADP reductase